MSLAMSPPQVWNVIRIETVKGICPQNTRVILERGHDTYIPAGDTRVEMDLVEDDTGGCYKVRVYNLHEELGWNIIENVQFASEEGARVYLRQVVSGLTDIEMT